MSEIPTTGRDKRIELERGGHVVVRAIPRSQMTDIAEAAGLTDRSVAGAMRFQELMCRSGIIGATDVKDTTGAAVPHKPELHSRLGRKIANVELYDALTKNDVMAIVAAANGELSEEQRGN